MRSSLLTLASIALLICCAAVAQKVPIEGGGNATLKDIAGTDTLVTIVLKPSGVRDTNLRILEVLPDYIAVATEDNERTAYTYDSIEKVIVQGGKIKTQKFDFTESRALRAEDKKTVDRAYSRAQEIFNNANQNQALKISAAQLLVLNNYDAASDYIAQLADSNDLMTQLDAAESMYLIGEDVPKDILDMGLASGNRRARAKAGAVSGFIGYRAAIPVLNTMVQDRSEDMCAPAAKALARMGVREVIPRLLTMLGELSELKGNAAVFALTELGGQDVIDQLKIRLRDVDGMERFRVLEVLHNLGAPEGREGLIETFNNRPTLAFEAALILGADGNWDAISFLRSRINRREDPTVPNLINRARAAAALIRGGDPTAMAAFQELLRADPPAVRIRTSMIMTDLGNRDFISMLSPNLEAAEQDVALSACTATVALARPEFRKRLVAAWK